MGQSLSHLAGNFVFLIPLNAIGEISDDIPLWALNIIELCGWEARGRISSLSKYWNCHTKTSHYYRYLCHRLCMESGLYVPSSVPPNETWKTLFLDLYRLRYRWKPQVISPSSSPSDNLQLSNSNAFKDTFKISVYVKFRPLEGLTMQDKPSLKCSPIPHSSASPARFSSTSTSPTNSTSSSPSRGSVKSHEDSENEEKDSREVTLPLHQRLAMIRMSHHVSDNRVALKLLAEEGDWFRDKWHAISNYYQSAKKSFSSCIPSSKFFLAGNDERPQSWKAFLSKVGSKKEKGKLIPQVHHIDSRNNRVIMLTPDAGLRDFSFDTVFPPNTTQKNTYDLAMKRLIIDFMNGFDGTALVYGQTGSGKSYTMLGKEEKAHYGRENQGNGIIPRACEEILTAMLKRKRVNGIDAILSISYVEIHGDYILDLLKVGQRCTCSKASSQRYVLNGAVEQQVESMKDISDLLAAGEQIKRKASTAMKDQSTRAHTVLILKLHQRSTKTGMSLTSKLFLADLGGSEQVKKSQLEAGNMREGINEDYSVGFQLGEKMRAAVYVNRSLLALKKCVEALQNRSSYIPYQDSKLTMLLSEGLGGNSKTSLIVCAHQDPSHALETISSLRFGEGCALIQNKGRDNSVIIQQLRENLNKEIKETFEEMSKKEKRAAEVGRAEEERKRLSQLLSQKQQLFGKSRTSANPVKSEKPSEKPSEKSFQRRSFENLGLLVK
jgi:hypothetical protein